MSQTEEPILVRCECGTAFRSVELVQGKKVRCPHCKKKWQMSPSAIKAAMQSKANQGGAIELKQFSGKGGTADKVLNVLSQQDGSEQDVMVTCAFCHDPITPDAVFCPNCGFAQQVADTSGGPRKPSKTLIILSFGNLLIKPISALMEYAFRSTVGLILTALILAGTAIGGWYLFTVLGSTSAVLAEVEKLQRETEGPIQSLLNDVLNECAGASKKAFGDTAGRPPFPKSYSEEMTWSITPPSAKMPKQLAFKVRCYRGDMVTGKLYTEDRTVSFNGKIHSHKMGMLDLRGSMDLIKARASGETQVEAVKIKVYPGYTDRPKWHITSPPQNTNAK